MERSKPKSIRFELLKQFEKIGNRQKVSKSKYKKPEKVLNAFFNKFYNLLRSFYYRYSGPEYDRIKDLAEPKLWEQLFKSTYWPKKFIHRKDKSLYNMDALKAQFSAKSCNFLMTQFLCLSTVLQEYGKVLSETTEECLESLFNYKCLDVHKTAGNSKSLWIFLVMDMAYMGNEPERGQNLEFAYGFLSSVLEENSHKQNQKIIEEDVYIPEQNCFQQAISDQEFTSTFDTLEIDDTRVLESCIPEFSCCSYLEMEEYCCEDIDSYLF